MVFCLSAPDKPLEWRPEKGWRIIAGPSGRSRSTVFGWRGRALLAPVEEPKGILPLGGWSVWVNGNRRLTFEFVDGRVYVIDYEDYH